MNRPPVGRVLIGVAVLVASTGVALGVTPAHHGNSPSSAPAIGIESSASGGGYYTLDAAGGVFTHGDAPYLGSVPELRRGDPSIGTAPIVDLSTTPTGDGYWILDLAGGIFTFGRAGFFGSVPQLRNGGVAIGPGDLIDLEPVGANGYYLMDEIGGIFAFGTAPFHGSLPGLRQAGAPIGPANPVSLVAKGGEGYWVLDKAGGIFTFGSLGFFGSLPERGVTNPAVAMAPTPDFRGYWILDDKGGVHAFGNANFWGSPVSQGVVGAVPVDITAHPDGTGYWVLFSDGRVFTFAQPPPPPPPPPASEPPPQPPPPGADVLTYFDTTADVDWCRGDIHQHGAAYGHDAFVVSIDTVCSSNPHVDAQWVDGFTGIVFYLDVDSDGIRDFDVFLDHFGSFFEATVYLSDEFIEICANDGLWDGGSIFAASFPHECIGSPPSFRFKTAFTWDEFPYNASAPVEIDYAPDSFTYGGSVVRP